MSDKSDFGEYITKQLNSAKGLLNKQDQIKVWKQLFIRFNDYDHILIQANPNVDNYTLLRQEIKEQLGKSKEYNTIINLFLEQSVAESRAKSFSINHKSKESIPIEEFVSKMTATEYIRTGFLKTIDKLDDLEIINIDMNQEGQNVENAILKLLTDYNKRS